MNTKKINKIGLMQLAISFLMITVQSTNAYTLDAKLKNQNNSPMFNFGQTFYELSEIKITDLPKDLQATNATLVDSGGSGTPTMQIYPTRIAYSGSISYQTPDGGTNIASTYISSDFKKILTKDGMTTTTLKNSFQGTKGLLILNGPIKEVNTTGTVHIEGIEDPKPSD